MHSGVRLWSTSESGPVGASRRPVEPNRVGLGALGRGLEVIPLEVMQHATDSLDQLIVGKLVLSRDLRGVPSVRPEGACKRV